jgi:DNA-binding winged helix-turn-helix (wHTH) protein
MAHGDRSVDVFVRKLRQKLERISPDWRYVHTHFGVGYRFAAEPAEVTGTPRSADGPGRARSAGPSTPAGVQPDEPPREREARSEIILAGRSG